MDFMESLAGGAKAGEEFAKSVEAARTAPETAQADLQKKQADVISAQQKNILGQYDVNAANYIDQGNKGVGGIAGQPVAPSADYKAIYGKTSVLKTKQDLAKQKLAKAEEMHKRTMSSKVYSETTRKNLEDAQQEAAAADKEFKTFQAESLRTVLDPVMTAKDQSSWDAAKPQLAQATAEAAVQAAIASGVPEGNLPKLRQDVIRDTMAKLPKQWGASAQSLINSKVAELKGIESENKMEDQRMQEEKHKLDMQKTRMEIQKLSRESDKIAASGINDPKEIHTQIKDWNTIANTQSNIINRITGTELAEAENKMKAAEDAKDKLFSSFGRKPTVEEENAYTLAKTEYDNLVTEKAQASTLLATAQQKQKDLISLSKAAGVTTPKLPATPKPAPKKDVEAVNWARKNPTDPDAIAILKLHGLDK